MYVYIIRTKVAVFPSIQPDDAVYALMVSKSCDYEERDRGDLCLSNILANVAKV
jgi:hypothetical protein